VRGENVAQTYQFVVSGAAELGFVALSQVRRPGREQKGSAWEVPATLYAPIVQQAVLVRDEPAARAFLAYLRGEAARGIIRSYGYGVP
jgi:molybdate transport system substrate-binding protein